MPSTHETPNPALKEARNSSCAFRHRHGKSNTSSRHLTSKSSLWKSRASSFWTREKMVLRWENELMEKQAGGFAGGKTKILGRVLVCFFFLSVLARHRDFASRRKMALIFKPAVSKHGIYFHPTNGKVRNMQLKILLKIHFPLERLPSNLPFLGKGWLSAGLPFPKTVSELAGGRYLDDSV